jgi:hypothetical protein
MNRRLSTLLTWARANIGLPEIFFFAGMASLYSGLSALISASLAQTVCGAVLVFISVLMAWKTA